MGSDQPYYPIDPRGLRGPHSLSSRRSLIISKKVKISFGGKFSKFSSTAILNHLKAIKKDSPESALLVSIAIGCQPN